MIYNYLYKTKIKKKKIGYIEEEKVEDTFGDYPPFAMTDYEQGGYRVSASSEYSTGDFSVWEAFDDNFAHNWIRFGKPCCFTLVRILPIFSFITKIKKIFLFSPGAS